MCLLSKSDELCLIRFHLPRGINRYKKCVLLLNILPYALNGRKKANFDTRVSEAKLIFVSFSRYRF